MAIYSLHNLKKNCHLSRTHNVATTVDKPAGALCFCHNWAPLVAIASFSLKVTDWSSHIPTGSKRIIKFSRGIYEISVLKSQWCNCFAWLHLLANLNDETVVCLNFWINWNFGNETFFLLVCKLHHFHFFKWNWDFNSFRLYYQHKQRICSYV